MTTPSETEIERNAMEFSANARLRLAAKLLASVRDSSRPVLSDNAALDLAEKRAAELDSGGVEGLDYRAEMRRIRASPTRSNS